MQKITLLDGHIVAEGNSVSHKILDLVQEYYQADANNEITKIDLNTTKHAQVFMTANNFATYWTDVESDKWIELMKNTDILVITNPMINFSGSVLVKNFIDSIAVANKTFSYKYSHKGDAIGLLTNLKKVIIISTQGAPEGWYPFGDHATWLEGTFKFLGAQEVKHIKWYGTKVKPTADIKLDELQEHLSDKLLEAVK
ncbi:FMN-dependent NADH-azoreductase [Mycoplasmopsis verecunda]|uniref:FMN-dependent NADH-azoreductase n=1 Tax=Mycoplasmopsis verecunda TaxID=171291 RepID=A0A1T4KLG5_9BACT|nr:FMN-dependent NADH-azoreductase [Mycoplasmopsis verecunda]WPB54285.1 FMN-dependent NADH-azoreductase [Mycoplasmopsis verecunda]SJZ43282.1 FMN-dependent NADH-azoreductase [Mycoplasmopsis verecunda]